MRRHLTICFTVTLITLAIAGTSFAIDADEIIRRHLEAKGGIDQLKALNTLQMKGKILVGDMVGELALAKRSPYFYSFILRTPRGITAHGCDGTNMWGINPRTGFRKLEGEEFERQLEQIVIEPLLGYKERGGRYEYVGIGDVDGDSCYELRYIHKTGDTVYSAFFDVHNYNMLKVESPAPKGVNEQFFEDFRDVDGYIFPFKVKVGSPAGKQTIIYDMITVNKPVPDSLFVMPDPSGVSSVAKPLPDSLRGIKPERD